MKKVTIVVDNKVVGKLRIAAFDDTSSLKKDGSSMFLSDTPERSINPEDTCDCAARIFGGIECRCGGGNGLDDSTE